MKSQLSIAMVIAAAGLMVGCGGMQTEPATYSFQPISLDGKTDGDRAMCGGIAGFQCPEGQRCLMRDSYPDAAGSCVGHQQYNNWRLDCTAVMCAMPRCASGYQLVTRPNSCCPTCARRGALPEGACNTAKQCRDQAHILSQDLSISCVGEWSCNTGWCAYTCQSEPVLLSE